MLVCYANDKLTFDIDAVALLMKQVNSGSGLASRLLRVGACVATLNRFITTPIVFNSWRKELSRRMNTAEVCFSLKGQGLISDFLF